MARLCAVYILWAGLGVSCFPSPCMAIDLSAHIRLGYGNYGMQDMKKLQKTIVAFYQRGGIDVQPRETFPSYFNFQIQVWMSFREAHNVGVFWQGLTAGGGAQYRDYSGELRSDLILTGHALGAVYERKVFSAGRMNLLLGIKSFLLVSHLEAVEKLTLFDTVAPPARLAFEAYGLGIEPSVVIEIRVSHVIVRFDAGFMTHSSESFRGANVFFDDDPEYGSGKEASPNWSGFRIGTGLGVSF